jgi:hypothetical protein
VAWLDQNARDTGVVLLAPGTAFGDIALVPAPFLKHPKGIRDISEWYMATAARPDYVHSVFEKQCEYALKNLATLIGLFGDRVQAVVTTGTDFGTQHTMYEPPEAVYREVRERIDTFNQDGGFVCNSVHNIQGNSPIENV